MSKFITKWCTSIKEISEKDWLNLCDNKCIPFYRWEWFYTLENSQSIVPKYGWQPLYLSIWNKSKLISFAPLFLKAHSYGEFIFDQAFCELANQLGVNYYPKLIGMSPVSPVEGYKFLIASGENEQELTDFMMQRIDEFCINNKILSCNFLYVDPKWRDIAEHSHCATWINKNSLWSANSDKNFNDYLSRFNANQRRNIKRERNYLRNAGIRVSVKNGNNVTLENIRLMYSFYEQHCSRWGPWGSKYLTKKFFEDLSSSQHRDKVVLFIANENDHPEPLAMSLCICDKEMLWGRYWGSNNEINFLHFELCYYSPIEWSFKRGIKSFDPGAGGDHKRRRGFLAKPQASLHRWYNPTMDKLIRLWLPKANESMMEEIKATNNEVPFKIDLPKLSLIK